MALWFNTHAKNTEDEDQAYKGRCRESRLDTKVLYYPHIPKAAVTLLKELYPSIYRNARVTFHVGEGSWVKQESTIATYGKIKITAAYEGRVEALGNPFQAGKYEWYSTEIEQFFVALAITTRHLA